MPYPFGLRSAPKIFSAVANTIAWVLTQSGIQHHLHYLDDFLFLCAPHSQSGAQALEIALQMFNMLGQWCRRRRGRGAGQLPTFWTCLHPK